MADSQDLTSQVWSVVKRVLAGVFLAQLITIIALVVSDAVRKRHNKPDVDIRTLTDPAATVEVDGSHATVFANGADLYEDMLKSIDAAEQHIYIESFIWKNDATGRRFKRAITDAARRGVKVHVIYDRFANLVVPRRFKRFDRSIHVLPFRLFNGTFPSFRMVARDHRKILVVDGEVGYVGGFNIGALYATQWRDTHVRFDGPPVWDLQNAFIDFWNEYRDPSDERQPAIPDTGTRDWAPKIRTHRNMPGQVLFPIRGMYIEAFDRAVSSISITQAYFIPDQDILGRLIAAARRGVDVRLLVPERSNHVVADVIARGFYGTMLQNGIRIFLYQDAMVHAKTATIDGRWSTIGTANIDRLSLVGNYEINVEIIDDDLARHMERIFDRDLDNARELTLEEWNDRRFLSRFSEAIIAPLRPLF